MKITNSWAVHTVYIGHTTHAILVSYTVEERNGTHTNVMCRNIQTSNSEGRRESKKHHTSNGDTE